MLRSIRAFARPIASASFALALAVPVLAAPAADTVSMAHDPSRYGIVVSATKTRLDPVEVPNATAVVSGRDLRRMGARTLADALIDVAGVEAGGGSDNGSHLTNIGMWGLKEFDALLVTVDGVPVGGPFNPSLAQIAVDDIERIEIVKGPQGSLHGVSAFAGMVQVFTDRSAAGRGTLTLGGGDFSQYRGSFGMNRTLNDWSVSTHLSGSREKGWQERTGGEILRGRVSLSRALGEGRIGFDVTGLHDRSDFGSPLPVDGGVPVPGFSIDRNYGVRDGELKHDVLAINSTGSQPLSDRMRFEHTVGFAYDAQRQIRSFFPDPGAITGVTGVGAAGVKLEPRETSLFADLRAITELELAGKHEWVTGAALTWGHTKASGIGFDFDQDLNDPASIPNSGDVPVGDHRSFDDKRTFLGLYAHDEWTPHAQFTLSAGGRYDHVSEKLSAFGQEVGFAAVSTSDSRRDAAWSGDLGGLVRLLSKPAAGLQALNVYANWKSSFKPAAPNLSEAENATILDPERTHSLEAGLKTRALDGQVSLDVSAFQMDFHNMVVGAFDAASNPILVNAGHERFKGWDVALGVSPAALSGLSFKAGYGWHDPRFVKFSFFTPDGTFRVVDGKLIELAPRLLWNLGASYAPTSGLGGWVSMRHQGQRALNRRNRFWDQPFSEVDAGLSFTAERFRVNVTGRNLGDDRHYVAESEIGDSQFYVSPPRRITAEITLPF
jgi:outer membrane receptor protein involved in Fe transport